MNTAILDEVKKLSPSERMALIDAIWDTLAHDELPVSTEERSLIDERLADAEAFPDEQRSWADVRAKLNLPRS
jgi:putative addiction module component (TIGR02574 family)